MFSMINNFNSFATRDPAFDMWIDGSEKKLEYCQACFDFWMINAASYSIDNGLSIVAIDDKTNQVCGAFIAVDNTAEWDDDVFASF